VVQKTGFSAAVVGARSPAQVQENASALTGDIPTTVFEQMSAISDQVMRHVPDTGNVYRYHP
jgi:aryl-alcohol dehydrogenase-like predicted oxidoreductase